LPAGATAHAAAGPHPTSLGPRRGRGRRPAGRAPPARRRRAPLFAALAHPPPPAPAPARARPGACLSRLWPEGGRRGL